MGHPGDHHDREATEVVPDVGLGLPLPPPPAGTRRNPERSWARAVSLAGCVASTTKQLP
jgi:hypothetical protein